MMPLASQPFVALLEADSPFRRRDAAAQADRQTDRSVCGCCASEEGASREGERQTCTPAEPGSTAGRPWPGHSGVQLRVFCPPRHNHVGAGQ